MSYTKPQVVIDLEEYNELKAKVAAIESKDGNENLLMTQELLAIARAPLSLEVLLKQINYKYIIIKRKH